MCERRGKKYWLPSNKSWPYLDLWSSFSIEIQSTLKRTTKTMDKRLDNHTINGFWLNFGHFFLELTTVYK